MAYPLIGNYGMCDDDYESLRPSMSALIVREYNDHPSNFRSTHTLDDIMKQYDIVGISEIDTRQLIRHIRNVGSLMGVICDIDKDEKEIINQLTQYEMKKDAVRKVSPKQIYTKKAVYAKYHVVAIDCGMKANIVRSLNALGCDVTVVPYDTSYQTILDLKPDGVFISNGPGDPEDVVETISTIKNLIGKVPMFGICLGHQMISLAYGAKTYKLKFGHRGGNHPVLNVLNNKMEITSQNHSYAVENESIKNTNLEITHINILDKTIEGVQCLKDKVFSVQYHPESAPGPEDSFYLFHTFLEMMEETYA